MGSSARRGSEPFFVWLFVLFILPAVAGCGADRPTVRGPIPEVKELLLVGITPHRGFRDASSPSHGLVDLTIVPRDATGAAVIRGDMDVWLALSAPTGASMDLDRVRERAARPGKPLAVALDLDSSSSMFVSDPQRLRVRAGQAFVEGLPARDLVGVFDFGPRGTAPMKDTRLLADFTTNRKKARDAMEQVVADGGTPMFESIAEVLAHFAQNGPAGDPNRALIVLGDGQPEYNQVRPEDCCETASRAGIPLSTVGFGPAADRSKDADAKAVAVLRHLAQCSGGTYSGVVSVANIGFAFTHLSLAARSGSLAVTGRMSPVPKTGTTVRGVISAGNATQTLAEASFTFVTP